MRVLLLRPLLLVEVLFGCPPTPAHFTVDVFPEHNNPWQDLHHLVQVFFFSFYYYALWNLTSRNLSSSTFNNSTSVFFIQPQLTMQQHRMFTSFFISDIYKNIHSLWYCMNKIQFPKSLHCLVDRESIERFSRFQENKTDIVWNDFFCRLLFQTNIQNHFKPLLNKSNVVI